VTDPPSLERLSRSECLALLREARVGRIAMRMLGGAVEIFPVTFVVHEECVVFGTDKGTKLNGLHDSFQVTFEVDDFDWYRRVAWSVVVKGVVEIARRPLHEPSSLPTDVGSWDPADKPYLVRLIPNSITGRRFDIDPAVVI
jgi:hypothetical protein